MIGEALQADSGAVWDGRVTVPPPPPENPWPREFGRYILLAPLAQGGMGDVCLALSGTLTDARRLCVLKTVRTEYAGDQDFIDRFLDEGKMLCALAHPNIAQLMEVGIEGPTPFVAMEYIAGVDLDAVVYAARATGRRLPMEFVMATLAGVLDAMAFAHKAKSLDGTVLHLVHRDLSPQNVRVSWEGDVKVLDFGTAHAVGRSSKTAHGLVFGKPGYMSPEQSRGEKVDARSDLFAIAVVGWELAAGRDFGGAEGVAHMEALAAGKLALQALHELRDDVPAGLDEWFARMSATRPEGRFDDASAARRELADIAHAHGLRLERDALVDVVERSFPGERDAEDLRVRRMVAAAKDFQPPLAPTPVSTARAATTEPQATSDASLIRGTRYRIGAKLGAGAMGEVYAAEHIDLGRTVALKIVFADRSNDPSVVQRFRLEARAIASLSHPNLVHVYDLGSTEDGRLFYAMERLVGESLRECLVRQRRLSPTECARIGAAIARGLAAAHAVGVVHRDIKPENVFLTHDGGVKVLDFGVAKTTNANILGGQNASATRAGEIFGSPGYMAPEQARGTPVDARTDVYALGALLYECATGGGMFEGASMVELLARQLADTPQSTRLRAPDAKIPVALDATVMRCLAKLPEARFQSASELADTLEQQAAQHSESEPVTAVRTVAAPRYGRRVLAGSLVAASVVISIAAWRLMSDPAPPPTAVHPVVAPRPVFGPPPVAPAVVAVHPPVVQPSPAVVRPLVAPLPVVIPSPVVTPVAVLPSSPAAVGVARDDPYHDLVRQAQSAIDRGRFDDAVEITARAIRLAPHQNSEARDLRGIALMRQGHRDQAIVAWQTAVGMYPRDHRAARLLSDTGAPLRP